MTSTIKKYNATSDYKGLTALIELEGEAWEDYIKKRRTTYQKSLEESITYVAYCDGVLCGYLRSINDTDMYIWIVDLLVHKKYRGNEIGKKLMERIATDFPDHKIFVLSDVDEYYKKLGYIKEGSIFTITT